MLSKNIQNRIINSIKPLNPNKIILFGSYAYGVVNDDSDIDLYIVSNENFTPNSYRENIDHYKKYAKKLTELKKSYAVDLVVHTKPMYKKFIEMGSSFSKEIIEKGVLLYEEDN